MLEEQQLAQFKSLVENAQSVVVLLPEGASIDEVSTGLALHLTFREMGKESRIAAVRMPQFKQPKLAGMDQLTTELGNQNLTISFNYTEEQVDKVSYHIGEETKKFYLTIKPRSGAAPLDTSSVEFSYTGASTDLLVFVGIDSLESLQQLYFGYEDLYEDTGAISFSTTDNGLGLIQATPTEESTLSELLTAILSALQLPVSPDTASNLLAGIEFGTKGLTQGMVGVGTFESLANLMKAGGVRQPYTTHSQPQTNQAQPQKNSNGKTELNIPKNGNKPHQQQPQTKKNKKAKSTAAARN